MPKKNARKKQLQIIVRVVDANTPLPEGSDRMEYGTNVNFHRDHMMERLNAFLDGCAHCNVTEYITTF